MLQVPEMLRQIDQTEWQRLQAACNSIYKRYFASIETIVIATLEVCLIALL